MRPSPESGSQTLGGVVHRWSSHDASYSRRAAHLGPQGLGYHLVDCHKSVDSLHDFNIHGSSASALGSVRRAVPRGSSRHRRRRLVVHWLHLLLRCRQDGPPALQLSDARRGLRGLRRRRRFRYFVPHDLPARDQESDSPANRRQVQQDEQKPGYPTSLIPATRLVCLSCACPERVLSRLLLDTFMCNSWL